jgi:uncharacterized Zn finger protein
MSAMIPCPMCAGLYQTLIGFLSGRAWLRCRDCGWNHDVPMEDIEYA